MGVKVVVDKGWKFVVIFYKNDDWGQDMFWLIVVDFVVVGIEVMVNVVINDVQLFYCVEVIEVFGSQLEVFYFVFYLIEGKLVVCEWLFLGGMQNMIFVNLLKFDEFWDSVGLQYFGDVFGIDMVFLWVESVDVFKVVYEVKFGFQLNGLGFVNSYDVVMIVLLVMEVVGVDVSGVDIVVVVLKVIDLNGVVIIVDMVGFVFVKEIFVGGGMVFYQGVIGNVCFDVNGDVFVLVVVWKFMDGGIEEVEYFLLLEIDVFMVFLK